MRDSEDDSREYKRFSEGEATRGRSALPVRKEGQKNRKLLSSWTDENMEARYASHKSGLQFFFVGPFSPRLVVRNISAALPS